jgi:hypothetical protein
MESELWMGKDEKLGYELQSEEASGLGPVAA